MALDYGYMKKDRKTNSCQISLVIFFRISFMKVIRYRFMQNLANLNQNFIESLFDVILIIITYIFIPDLESAFGWIAMRRRPRWFSIIVVFEGFWGKVETFDRFVPFGLFACLEKKKEKS